MGGDHTFRLMPLAARLVTPCKRRPSSRDNSSNVRHVRPISIKTSPVTHVAPIMHTRQTFRSAALFSRLKDRDALDMVGHRKGVTLSES